jgi:hypothetical protein
VTLTPARQARPETANEAEVLELTQQGRLPHGTLLNRHGQRSPLIEPVEHLAGSAVVVALHSG